MNSTKKNIRRVFWLYFALFMLIILYMVKLVAFDQLPSSPYNQRTNKIDTEILRGSIFDANGNVLAQSADEGFARSYPYNREFAHIIGYIDKGKYALESSANFLLQKLHLEIVQRTEHVLNGTNLKGEDIHTTLDSNLQSLTYELLGNKKGGIVVMEPSTGKILAMVSYPNFNPNTISSDWDKLVSDAENSALLNRSTQGLYPPGSVFKLITAAAALTSEKDELTDIQDFIYNCQGEETFDGYTIHCYEKKIHGEINMQQALSVSCNCYFAHIGNLIGAEELKKMGERFLFNQKLPYELEYSLSRLLTSSPKIEIDAAALAQTSIGQGKTLASPLQIALVGAAIANGGVLMKPYIIDYEKSFNGSIKNKRLPEKAAEIIPANVAYMLKDMMVSAVETGTGKNAKINGISVAGKTGTAQNEKDADHAWFVAFAPADNPTIAVTVLLENGGSGSNAATIAKKIIEQKLNYTR